MGLSNEIEDILDPYIAADEAVRLCRRYKVGKYSAAVESDDQDKTMRDSRFLGLEHKISIAVEKPAPVELNCCSPGCQNKSVKNSHALQKNGILGTLSDAEGRILQTKITPFSKSNPMKEIGVRYASVFPGYCKTCEQTVFSRAERHNAEIDLENVSLLLWRALCFIRFRRAQEVKARAMMISKPQMYDVIKEHEDPFVGFSSTFYLKNSELLPDRWTGSGVI